MRRSGGHRPLLYNSGLVTYPPQIDALNFINSGTFDSDQPDRHAIRHLEHKELHHSGTMIGAVASFDTAPNTGPRKLAANSGTA